MLSSKRDYAIQNCSQLQPAPLMFAAQLQSVVTECLDNLVPWKAIRRHARKPSAKWLTTAAVAAKRQRRRLERKRSETDRLAYCAACRHANTLINQSRRNYVRTELEARVDPRQRWKVAKRLLHTGNTKQSKVTANIGLCDSFSKYFISKIDLLRHNISAWELSDCQLSQPLPLNLLMLIHC
jgi:hypothetical protein